MMIRTGSPKQLWDHCIILQALICSCTTNSIYMTAGQVPDTIIKEEVATLLLLVINHGLTIYEIYGVPSYGLPRGMKRLAVIGPKYPLRMVMYVDKYYAPSCNWSCCDLLVYQLSVLRV